MRYRLRTLLILLAVLPPLLAGAWWLAAPLFEVKKPMTVNEFLALPRPDLSPGSAHVPFLDP